MKNITIKNPDDVASAILSLSRTIRQDNAGDIPESIRGWMLAVPCKRMLRGIYGSAWRAIFHWAWCEITSTVSDHCYEMWRKLGWFSQDEEL